VISPQLDDAALSVGATIAATAASGGRVLLLTVLADDLASSAEEWDASAGFATHADAVRARPPTDEPPTDCRGAGPACDG
jgi:LmbE family N-acetylglucosaminyl deacetylase